MKSSAIFLLTILTVIAGVESAFAQTDTIFATYTYTMGDNDTKSDARQLCFLYAKRQCLEKAGTYVQSELNIRKTERMGTAGSSYDELTQQDISTFTGAFVKVDIVSEEMNYSGGTISITMAVKAAVNTQSVFDQILAVLSNKQLEQQVRDQQEQIAELESNIREMQRQLTAKQPEAVQQVRIERKEAFSRIHELEEIKMEISSKAKLAIENVELYMTPQEVIKVAGQQRAIEGSEGNWLGYNYGNVWVVFDDGLIVTCLVRSEYYQAFQSRAGYLLNPYIYGTKALIKW